MAETKIDRLEREYVIPLRPEWRKVVRYKKTNKAVKTRITTPKMVTIRSPHSARTERLTNPRADPTRTIRTIVTITWRNSTLRRKRLTGMSLLTLYTMTLKIITLFLL